MGGDGGQVIDRATMVKCKGYGLTKESGGRYNNSLGEMNSYVQMTFEDRGMGQLERHRTRMTQCFLSQAKLQEPVVACRLGNLYNKEAVIGALLNKSMPTTLAHIRALKDVKLCLLSWGEGASAVLTQMTVEAERRRLVCPVTREDLDTGGARAVLIWTTGAVVSAKALKELKMKECPVTGVAFDKDKDLIPLAPDDEELSTLRAKLPERKKRKNAAVETTTSGDAAASKSEGANGSGSTADQRASPSPTEEPEAAKKARKVDPSKSEVFNGLFRNDKDKITKDAFGCPLYNRGALIQ